MLAWLTAIVNKKLLVVAGMTYVLGYVTWQFHAFINGLGMLPVLEAQYFLAGFIPMIIVVLVYITIKGYIQYRPLYIAWIESARAPYRRIIGYIYSTTFLAMLLSLEGQVLRMNRWL